MKFFKFKNSIWYSKILFILIVFICSFNDVFAQNNVPTVNTVPNQTNTVIQPNIGTQTNNGTQQTYGVQQNGLPTTNQVTTPTTKKNTSRIPTNGPTNVRDVETNVKATKAIAQEEANRLAKLDEIAKDAKKSSIIKRTFGSSLFNVTTLDPTASVNIATPSNYILGPGDKLSLDIYGYSQFTQNVTINSDGFIVLVKAGVVNIGGLTLEDAERKIRSAFSRIFIGLNTGYGFAPNTFLKVALTGYRMIKVKVTGEVIAPGSYTVTSFTSLLNVIYACGGPNDIGSYRDIRLIRNNRVVTSLDLYDIITKGYAKGDMLLKDQDIIYVPTYVSRIAVEGNLKRNGLFEILPHESLFEAINFAGGFDQYAYSDRIKIYRNTPVERKILDIKSAEFKSMRVFTGDSIVVEKLLERFQNLVNIDGAIFRPGEYSVDNNPTLLTLIKNAEGLKNESLQGRVIIVRTNDDLSTTNISVNLQDIRNGKISDPTLKRQDKVIIPSTFDLIEESTVKIQGAINNLDAKTGVTLPYVKNMTIQDLLVRVGGLTEAASMSKVEIVRRKRNVDPKQIDAQISDIIEFNIKPDLSVDSQVESTILYPFDEVFIRTSPNYEKQKFVSIMGQVIYPGKYGIKYKDEKISDLISRAGGLSPTSYIKGATLVRKTVLTDFQTDQRQELFSNLNINTKVKVAKEANVDDIEKLPTLINDPNRNIITETIGIDLEKILKNPGAISDIILQDGDEIHIPIKLQTVRIEGEILYPTAVKYLPHLKFMDYISKSGGYTRKSARNRAFVVYANGSVDRTRRFIFAHIYPIIEPGCEIIVPGKTITAQTQIAQTASLLGTFSGMLTTVISVLAILKLNKN